jgi:hypothetical protein
VVRVTERRRSTRGRSGCRPQLGGDHRRQRHQPAGDGPHLQAVQVLDAATLVQIGLQDDVVFLAVLDVGRGLARAEHGFQRAADRLGGNAQGRGLVLVDLHRQARRGRLIVEARTREARIVLGFIQDRLQPFGQLDVVVADGDQVDVGAATATTAAALEGAAHAGHGADAGDLRQILVELGGDLVGGLLRARPRA